MISFPNEVPGRHFRRVEESDCHDYPLKRFISIWESSLLFRSAEVLEVYKRHARSGGCDPAVARMQLPLLRSSYDWSCLPGLRRLGTKKQGLVFFVCQTI